MSYRLGLRTGTVYGVLARAGMSASTVMRLALDLCCGAKRARHGH